MRVVEALAATLHRGEAEAIVLMEEQHADLLLLDDLRGRKEAERRAHPFTGTLGLLREAQRRGLIGAVHPVVAELRGLGFWISTQLLERIRQEDDNGGQR
jgi:predicted nucleic acid-binding protein